MLDMYADHWIKIDKMETLYLPDFVIWSEPQIFWSNLSFEIIDPFTFTTSPKPPFQPTLSQSISWLKGFKFVYFKGYNLSKGWWFGNSGNRVCVKKSSQEPKENLKLARKLKAQPKPDPEHQNKSTVRWKLYIGTILKNLLNHKTVCKLNMLAFKFVQTLTSGSGQG